MPKVQVDFSETKERGAFSPTNVEEGDYLLTIKKSEVVQIKSGDNAGKDQLVFTLVSDKIRGASYPYYTPLSGKSAWKLRAILEAAGFNIAGKKALGFDTDRLNGKTVGAELVDDEYNGKIKSSINNVFPASDLEEDPSRDDVIVSPEDDGSVVEVDLDEL